MKSIFLKLSSYVNFFRKHIFVQCPVSGCAFLQINGSSTIRPNRRRKNYHGRRFQRCVFELAIFNVWPYGFKLHTLKFTSRRNFDTIDELSRTYNNSHPEIGVFDGIFGLCRENIQTRNHRTMNGKKLTKHLSWRFFLSFFQIYELPIEGKLADLKISKLYMQP